MGGDGMRPENLHLVMGHRFLNVNQPPSPAQTLTCAVVGPAHPLCMWRPPASGPPGVASPAFGGASPASLHLMPIPGQASEAAFPAWSGTKGAMEGGLAAAASLPPHFWLAWGCSWWAGPRKGAPEMLP